MACRNAVFSLDDWFICTITGDSCRFINPVSAECARRFIEGPNALRLNDRVTTRRKK